MIRRLRLVCLAGWNSRLSITAASVRLSGIALSVGVVVCSLAANAQEIDPVHGKPGSFVLGMDLGGAQLDAATRHAAAAVTANILTVVRRDRAIASPVGYTVRIHRALGKRTDWADFDSGLPFFAGVVGTLFVADAKPSPNAFSGPDFGIYVNTVLQCPVNAFTHPLSKHPWMLDGKLPVIEGGRVTGEFRGHAVYDGHCVVLSRHRELPFAPLTREQYARLEIGTLKERVDSTRQQFAGSTPDENVRAAMESAVHLLNDRIARRQQELDAMDASARRLPAFVQLGYSEGKLVDTDAADAVPLSVPNPAFFNQSLPAGAVQAISVFIPFMQSGPAPADLPSGLPNEWRPAMEKIRDQLDWTGLETLLQ